MNAFRRLWPRSLAGEMALLIALALFAAQAVNSILLLNERRALRLEQVVGPVTARIVDAVQNRHTGPIPSVSNDYPPPPQMAFNRWHRVHRIAYNPIDPRLPHATEVEAALSHALVEAGIHTGRVVTGIRPIAANDQHLRYMPPSRIERLRRSRGELLIAVEQPGHGWLILGVPWRRSELPIVWRLIVQTLVLYGVILIPVLWAGRQITRPLRELARATRAFRPGEAVPDLPELGPHDVRAVVSAFNALRLRVSGMLDEKDRMLGAIGHDLKTPLAALRVRVESVDDEADRTRMVETIDDMNRTLDDILSLARLGRPSEPATMVDVGALVEAVVEDFRDLDADVRLVDAPRIRLRLRPALMRRAVRNLIENAVKFAGTAAVSVSDDGTTVRIAVADDGPGIPEKQLADVFEAFTRVEGSRNRDTGGVGLGLALARAIVREAAGDVTLSNRAEGGLLACIELPHSRA